MRAPDGKNRPARREARGRRRAVALALTAVLGGLGAWLLVSRGGDDERTGDAIAVTEGALRELASAGATIFWVGPREGFTYELTQVAEGQVRLRYLPAGVPVGDERQRYLTIGTYVFDGAFGALQEEAEEAGADVAELPGGGIALASGPTSVHFSFPDANYQVEVYDPAPGTALRLAAEGRVTRVE